VSGLLVVIDDSPVKVGLLRPIMIVSDNGTELTSRAILQW
jgi:hypothetical protein